MIIPMLCVTIFVILVVWFLLPRVARLMIHTPTAISIFVCLSMVQLMAVLDRKSGSAGMPRPISYAVFCLKKKKILKKSHRIYANKLTIKIVRLMATQVCTKKRGHVTLTIELAP